jgi:hypothetical protein
LCREWLVIIPDSPPQLCFFENLSEEQDFLVDAPSPNLFLKTPVLVLLKIVGRDFLKTFVAQNSAEML